MIVYNLRCRKGHEFEGWFRDSAAFDAQSADGSLACPVCGARRVEKSIMAPALAGTGAAQKPPADTDAQAMRQFMTGLRKYIQDHAEYVGPRFAEEARRIHYGEAAHRHIYGEATIEEARELVEEGVDVTALPRDTDSAN